jgi:hypothetical protein
MTGSSAALVSVEENCAWLHELAGVEVSAKQVERAAEALGMFWLFFKGGKTQIATFPD